MKGVFSPCVLLLAIATGACSERVNVCQASVKKTLINPETAEFYDGREIEPSEYVSLAVAGYRVRTGSVMPVENQANLEITMHNIMKKYPTSKFVTFRMRAEGRLGNKITSQELCLIDGDDCSCTDPTNG